ncbi:hypothetical protein CsSME_00000680 [Camellia sinensis var. sinensis]
MVRIQVKHGGDGGGDDLTEFLYDCPATSTTDEIARVLTQIANLQSTIQRLFLQLQPRLSLLPQHHQALSEAKSYVSKDQVLHNKPLVISALKGHVKSIEREFSTNYHIMGFPDSNLQQLLTVLMYCIKMLISQTWNSFKRIQLSFCGLGKSSLGANNYVIILEKMRKQRCLSKVFKGQTGR